MRVEPGDLGFFRTAGGRHRKWAGRVSEWCKGRMLRRVSLVGFWVGNGRGYKGYLGRIPRGFHAGLINDVQSPSKFAFLIAVLKTNESKIKSDQCRSIVVSVRGKKIPWLRYPFGLPIAVALIESPLLTMYTTKV